MFWAAKFRGGGDVCPNFVNLVHHNHAANSGDDRSSDLEDEAAKKEDRNYSSKHLQLAGEVIIKLAL